MTEDIKKEKLIIIGGGPAGLAAGIYASRAGIDPLILMGPEPGGQITLSAEIENYPGFPESINGFDLMQKIIKQVEKHEGRMVYEVVEEVDFSEKPYKIKTDSSNYEVESVIIATGASPRKLGLDKEKEFIGRGVSYCATCDGAFFKNKVVVVVGGGDVALEEAYYLTKFCSKVYLIHRRDEFRGTRILGDRVKKNEKIEILWNTEVRDILGEEKVSGIIVENKKTGKKKELSEVEGLFIAIGHIPNTKLFTNDLHIDDYGFIIANKKYMTSKEGIYAAGDVQDPYYRQIVTSAGAGAASAIEAGRYLEGLE